MDCKKQYIQKINATLNRMTDFQIKIIYRFAQRLLREQGD